MTVHEMREARREPDGRRVLVCACGCGRTSTVDVATEVMCGACSRFFRGTETVCPCGRARTIGNLQGANVRLALGIDKGPDAR